MISSISSKGSSPAGSGLLDLDEYGLLEAADGQAALEVVRDERPDADAYLVKPFSSLALLDAVKRLTDG